MEKIIVESALGEKLAELDGQAVLCDSSGRAIGFFSPLGGCPRADDLRLEPPLSIAEINELRKDRSGKPLEEILNRLGIQ